MFDLLLRVLIFAAGVALVVYTVMGAIRSFVLPRNDLVLINKWLYLVIRQLFTRLSTFFKTFAQRDQIMAMYAPVSLVALEILWLVLVSIGYTAMYWALGHDSWVECFQFSNSSLLTLGSEKSSSLPVSVLSYSEATLGLLLVTLLISYLPTIYQAYSRRELVVGRLERRAGTPVSALGLLVWLHRISPLQDEGSQWEAWEEWFMELEENHTSLPVLAYFRSPQPGRSWVTALGTILDTAALRISTVDKPRDPRIELSFKAGCIAISRITRFFQERTRSEPAPYQGPTDPMEDPSHEEFMRAYKILSDTDVPVVADQEAAWKKFHLLRSRYTQSVEYLAKLTMAPAIKPITPHQEDIEEADQ